MNYHELKRILEAARQCNQLQPPVTVRLFGGSPWAPAKLDGVRSEGSPSNAMDGKRCGHWSDPSSRVVFEYFGDSLPAGVMVLLRLRLIELV